MVRLPRRAPRCGRAPSSGKVGLIPALFVVLLAGGCGWTERTTLPDPAASFCEASEGVVSGPEPMCELPDGTIVDGWRYLRSNILPGAYGELMGMASVFCEDRGGLAFGPEPMCELPDGRVVDAWDYLRDETATR
jgi:putative hemolysin